MRRTREKEAFLGKLLTESQNTNFYIILQQEASLWAGDKRIPHSCNKNVLAKARRSEYNYRQG